MRLIIFSETLIKLTILVFLTLLFILNYSNSNKVRLYTRSITDLQELARFDIEIVRHFTQVYLASELLLQDSKTKRLVENYLLDFYESSGFADFKEGISTTDIKISHNPICGYRLIRRVKYFLRRLSFRPSFFRLFGNKSREIFHFFWKNGWPSNRDVNEINDSIYKIQQVHEFDVDQLANGRISTVQTNCTFDSISCQAIAIHFGVIEKDIASQIQWLEMAKEKAIADKKTSVPFLMFSLRKAISKHNINFDEETMLELNARSFDREILHIPGDFKTAKKVRTINYERLKKQMKNTNLDYNNILAKNDREYWEFRTLCSGENLQTEAEKSLLFCWYESKAHPNLAIGPVKMEFLARDPDVVQIYDILHKRETEKFIEHAISNMKPSSVQKIDFGYKKEDDHSYKPKSRTSVNSWLSYGLDKNAVRKIEEIAGLQVLSSSELLQVASYLFGGVFQPHHDELFHQQSTGSRIATFMFYFNNVELGGKTAFPNLGFAATPVKGSAIFWHNLYTDGASDDRVRHGACPVLLGEKWTANKWIHYEGQFSVRKCALTQRQRFQIPFNNIVASLPAEVI